MQKIPGQVQAQSDRADELMKGKPEDDKGKAAENQDHKPLEAAKPAEDTVESLKHKLSVLQGKYNKEIEPLKENVNLLTGLKNQVRTLSGQLQEANALIGQLQRQITEKPKEEKPDDNGDPLASFSKEDREYLLANGYDDRFIEIVGKVAKKTAKPDQPADTVHADRLAEIEREVMQERTDRFWSELSKAVPDWEPVNKSDEFNDWLDGVLPYSDKTRRDALKGAQAQLDFATVIKVFNDFKAVAAPKKDDPKPLIDPEKQIEPAASVGHVESPDGDKTKGRIYTRQEVKDFYNDYKEFSIGKWHGKKRDFAAEDAAIIKANTEGRIQG